MAAASELQSCIATCQFLHARDLWGRRIANLAYVYLFAQSQLLLLDIGNDLVEGYKVPGQFVQVRTAMQLSRLT